MDLARATPLGLLEKINAIILCEDSSDTTSPIRTLHHLRNRFIDELSIQTHIWGFGSLGHPAIWTTALQSAPDSALIVVSVHSHQPLPAVVESFLSQALALRCHQPTALILFSAADSSHASTQDSGPMERLRDLSTAFGTDFFVTKTRQAANERTLPSRKPGDLGFNATTQPSSGVLHWGINE